MLKKFTPARSKTSKASSVWKVIKTYPLRSGLAICGLASIAAVVLRKKNGGPLKNDEKVEDFTSDQQAMLRRIREICDEYNPNESQANGAAI